MLAADTTGLPNLAAKAPPIGKAERMARIAKAKQLMAANNIGALPYTVVIDRSGRIVATRKGAYRGPELEAIVGDLREIVALIEQEEGVEGK